MESRANKFCASCGKNSGFTTYCSVCYNRKCRGICLACTNPSLGYPYCKPCSEARIMRERMIRNAKGLCANFRCQELAVKGFTHCEKCHGAYMASRVPALVVPIAKSPVAIEHIVKDDEFPTLIPVQVSVPTQNGRSYLRALTNVSDPVIKTESELVWEQIVSETAGKSWADMADDM